LQLFQRAAQLCTSRGEAHPPAPFPTHRKFRLPDPRRRGSHREIRGWARSRRSGRPMSKRMIPAAREGHVPRGNVRWPRGKSDSFDFALVGNGKPTVPTCQRRGKRERNVRPYTGVPGLPMCGRDNPAFTCALYGCNEIRGRDTLRRADRVLTRMDFEFSWSNQNLSSRVERISCSSRKAWARAPQRLE